MGKRRKHAETFLENRVNLGRVLLEIDEQISEVNDYLEALHMMARDLDATPPEEATAAFRTVAQRGIDCCGVLLDRCWQARQIVQGHGA